MLCSPCARNVIGVPSHSRVVEAVKRLGSGESPFQQPSHQESDRPTHQRTDRPSNHSPTNRQTNRSIHPTNNQASKQASRQANHPTSQPHPLNDPPARQPPTQPHQRATAAAPAKKILPGPALRPVFRTPSTCSKTSAALQRRTVGSAAGVSCPRCGDTKRVASAPPKVQVNATRCVFVEKG